MPHFKRYPRVLYKFGNELDPVITQNLATYVDIIDQVKNVFSEKRYNLIETLAVEISENLMTNQKIKSLDISIKKESPPIDTKLNSVEVNLRKTR